LPFQPKRKGGRGEGEMEGEEGVGGKRKRGATLIYMYHT